MLEIIKPEFRLRTELCRKVKVKALLSASFVFMLLSPAFSQPFFAERRAPARANIPGGVRVYRNIEYAQVEGRSLLLDLYVPLEEAVPVPLVVWIHGGGWRSGSKENCLPALKLLEYGFAVASINYRLSGISSFPVQIEDCKSAVRFLRYHADSYGIDAQRVGAWGSSAGGHLASLLGTSGKETQFDKGGYLSFSSSVQAVCSYYGPSYLPGMQRRFGGARLSPEELLIGGPLNEKKELAEKASPVTYIDSCSPPFFIVHGDMDKVVPLSQSEILHNSLLKAGVESQLHVIGGAGHGGPEFTDKELISRVAGFFNRHIRKEVSDASDNKVAVPEGNSGITNKEIEGGLLYFATYREREYIEAVSNPYIKGVLFNIYWSDVESEEGVYDWTGIEKLMNPWIQSGKKIALRVMWSSNGSWPDPSASKPVPDWLLKKGAVIAFSEKTKSEVPLMWDPVYKENAQRFVIEIARKFDGNSSILFIDLSPGAETNPYRFGIDRSDKAFRNSFKNASVSNGEKYSNELWINTVKEYIDFSSASFSQTRVLITLNTGVLEGPSSFMEIGRYCVERGLMVGQNGLRGVSYKQRTRQGDEFREWSKSVPLYFEMVAATSSDSTGSLMDVMKAAERVRCSYLGVYASDVLKGTRDSRIYLSSYEEALRFGASVIPPPQ